MRKAGDVILSGLLACFVGTTYFLIEVVYKTVRGHPEGISWTMLVLALLVGIIMERMGAELPWRCPIWAQAILCGLAITAAEFIAGDCSAGLDAVQSAGRGAAAIYVEMEGCGWNWMKW